MLTYNCKTRTVNASIWTVSGNLPNGQIAGASWIGLTVAGDYGTCCALVTINGISGVTLTGGQSYYMVIGPVDPSDNSYNLWNLNNQGESALNSFSTDGGQTWAFNGTPMLGTGAFDVLGSSIGIPEPGSLWLLGTGLAGIIAARRRQ